MSLTFIEAVPVFRIFSVEKAPWNAKLMEVRNSFGNRIRYNEDLKKK